MASLSESRPVDFADPKLLQSASLHSLCNLGALACLKHGADLPRRNPERLDRWRKCRVTRVLSALPAGLHWLCCGRSSSFSQDFRRVCCVCMCFCHGVFFPRRVANPTQNLFLAAAYRIKHNRKTVVIILFSPPLEGPVTTRA